MADYSYTQGNLAPWGTGVKSAVISDGVTSIGKYAFFKCTSLKSVSIADSVTTIGANAFNTCSGLTDINLPYGITVVGGYTFGKCSSLKDIYYIGTEDQWGQVTKGNGWNKNNPEDQKVHFLFTVTAGANPAAYGSVSIEPNPNGEVPGTYKAGTSVTVTATPNTTYSFVSWTENGSAVSTDASYIITDSAKHSLTANFELQKFRVIFADEDGTVLQTGDVEYGTTPAYTGEAPTKASDADYVYTFAGWTPEIVPVTGEATYTAT